MPTMREASTPSRRAMRKAESTGTPVENDLQQRFQSNPFQFVSSSAHALSIDTVEWWLASIYSNDKTDPCRRHRSAALVGADLSGVACASPAVPECETRRRALLRETRSETGEETCGASREGRNRRGFYPRARRLRGGGPLCPV